MVIVPRRNKEVDITQYHCSIFIRIDEFRQKQKTRFLILSQESYEQNLCTKLNY